MLLLLLFVSEGLFGFVGVACWVFWTLIAWNAACAHFSRSLLLLLRIGVIFWGRFDVLWGICFWLWSKIRFWRRFFIYATLLSGIIRKWELTSNFIFDVFCRFFLWKFPFRSLFLPIFLPIHQGYLLQLINKYLVCLIINVRFLINLTIIVNCTYLYLRVILGWFRLLALKIRLFDDLILMLFNFRW